MSKKKKSKNKNQTSSSWSIFIFILIIICSSFYKFNHDNIDDGGFYLNFVDVGQGDCELITCGGTNVLIDCGEDSKAADVIAYLEKNNVQKLDYVVATHPHSDHMGGMHSIIENYDIGEVIIPHLPDKDVPTTRFFEKFLDACDKKKTKISEAKVGRNIKFGGADAEIISPNSQSYDDVNNYSVGLLITYGENRFILTGDAETVSEKEILENGVLKKVDVYKAGHHGSTSSGSKKFLEAIQPDIAVISCGAGNSYGHPAKKTLTSLKKYTDEIYRTDLNGTIVVYSDGKTVSVTTERQGK